jgi:hypothetical protein
MEEVASNGRKGVEAIVFLHVVGQFYFKAHLEDLWSIFFFC